MKSVLTLVRGLPGSGKSSYAESLCDGFIRQGLKSAVYAADDFFTVKGVYTFDPKRLGEAHGDCQRRTDLCLQAGMHVIVANTFTSRWEMEPYLSLAEKHGARVVIVDCFDGGMSDYALSVKNVHGVPAETIALMRSRWEHDWRSGNPIAPWMRK
jgi:predicted kinase